MATRSNKVGPVPFKIFLNEDSRGNIFESTSGESPEGFHLSAIKESRVQGDNLRHDAKMASVAAGEAASATGSASHLLSAGERKGSQDTIDGDGDSKGKRFHSWLTNTDGSPGASGTDTTGDKGGLLAYFNELTVNNEDIDFIMIDHILENGSDINATSEATGGNIMHTVAAHWDKSVADYLMHKGLNIHQRDKDGKTPLHVAASTNHVEIVEWLTDHGAELEARTTVEKQTPLHYAARYDSVQVMQILVDKGGDCETVDYKGRTALHLAAELDRTGAVECLISVPILAEVRVQDDAGNHAIASMIRTMPQVALTALDQLHRIAPAKRKQYFLLNHLEPEPRLSSTRGVKTPFEVAVEEKRRAVLSHPVMKTLISQKWKFMQWVFYGYLALYFIFLFSWTLLIAYPAVQEKHVYNFPTDIWRIIVGFVAIVTYLLQIVEEVFEVVLSKNKFKDYKTLRKKSLQDDLNNLGLGFAEERQFFESEIHKLKKRNSNYFKDPWNLVDLVTYALMFVLILIHAGDVFFHTAAFASWVARVSCFVVLLIWFRLFKHARGFLIFGPLVAIIGQSLGDIMRYFILYAILFVPYVVCFSVLFGGIQSASLSDSDREDLAGFHRVAIMIFRMGLVDDYPYSSLRSIDEAMAAILVLTFLFFLAVVGFNLFIALLSDTFQRVYDNAQSIALLEQAKLILSYEEKMCACFINRYLDHIHKNCSPRAEFYDDDERYSKESNSEVRKITHQIHSIVSEMHTRQHSSPESTMNDLRAVSEVFVDCTDQQDDKLAHITQQLEELTAFVKAGKAEPADPVETGYIPTRYPPGSFGSNPPSMPHASNRHQPTAATPTSPLITTSEAPSLSHPHISPTRTALHSFFNRRDQHLKALPPITRKHSFVSPLARPHLLGPSHASLPRGSELSLGRSESEPGTQPRHRRVHRPSIQNTEDVEWEKKSQPMRRRK